VGNQRRVQVLVVRLFSSVPMEPMEMLNLSTPFPKPVVAIRAQLPALAVNDFNSSAANSCLNRSTLSIQSSALLATRTLNGPDSSFMIATCLAHANGAVLPSLVCLGQYGFAYGFRPMRRSPPRAARSKPRGVFMRRNCGSMRT